MSTKEKPTPEELYGPVEGAKLRALSESMKPSLYATKYARILDDPGSSSWLKSAADALAVRDPQDALCDAEALLALAQCRWAEVLAQATAPPNADAVLLDHMERGIAVALSAPTIPRPAWMRYKVHAAIDRILEREG